MAKNFGLEVEVVSPDDIEKLYPMINLDGALGGVFLPKDGQANPIDATQAYAKGARMGGARIAEGVKVETILVEGGRAVGVRTEQGEIRSGTTVLAAGMWSRELAKPAGVSIPLHAAEHFYIVTEPIEGLAKNLPVLRIPDECAYYKEDAGKILLGAFEPEAKPWGMKWHTRGFRVRHAAGGFRSLRTHPGTGDRTSAHPGRSRYPDFLQRPGKFHTR